MSGPDAPCCDCGEAIKERKYIKIKQYNFHTAHFRCKHCRCSLVPPQPFKVKKGSFYCLDDYLLLFKSGGQDRPSSSSPPAVPVVCTQCDIALEVGTSVFTDKHGKVYCKRDYHLKFCKQCSECGEWIVKQCVSVNGESYHPRCMKCHHCAVKLNKYRSEHGYLTCEGCMGQAENKEKTCDTCNNNNNNNNNNNSSSSSSSLLVKCAGQRVHAECLVCSSCKDVTSKTKMVWLDKAWWCLDCALVSSSLQQKTLNKQQKNDNSTDTKITMLPQTQHTQVQWRPSTEVLGVGSYGKVLLGLNELTGELLAVKQIKIQEVVAERRSEVRQEGVILRALSHEHIIRYIHMEETSLHLNILMEYVPGKPLTKIISIFGPLPETTASKYTLQLLQALAHCHSAGVVHRDIKALNILIHPAGKVKLGDFGSAIYVATGRADNGLNASQTSEVETTDNAAEEGTFMTAAWTAPEVMDGVYGFKMDVWSVGCVVLEMLSGKHPWAEKKFTNEYRALYHIANTNEIPQFPDQITPECTDFLTQCFQRKVTERPTVQQLLNHPWLLR